MGKSWQVAYDSTHTVETPKTEPGKHPGIDPEKHTSENRLLCGCHYRPGITPEKARKVRLFAIQ